MFSILRLFVRVAAIAIVAATMMSTVNAQSAIDSAKNPLELATKQNNLVFAAYMVLLVLVLIFTYFLWRSGNNVQDAIRKDADARIQEAKQGVEQLKKDNLTLSSQLATLQDEASKQQERAAKAEESLLRLRNELKDRQISPQQRQELVRLLKGGPNGPIQIIISPDVSDASALANQIHDTLHEAGWTNVPIRLAMATDAVGLSIGVHDVKSMPSYVELLRDAFSQIGIHIDILEYPSFPSELIQLNIGHKPGLSPN